MARIRYEQIAFSDSKLELIEEAESICEEYAEMGLDITLRQLFYRFVTLNRLRNTQNEYKKLGKLISDARLAGLIDWDHIVDRTRALRGLRHWENPKDFIGDMAHEFRIDKWQDQPNNVEVWIEKDALVGVLQSACVPLDTPFFSCRGYASATAVWEAAQRIRRKMNNGHAVTILYLGDHDPSGIDMTRYMGEKLYTFIYQDLHREDGMSWTDAREFMRDAFEFRPIALHREQIDQYNLPTNPVKLSDTRARGYIMEHGRHCWELDALPPQTLVEIIQSHVRALRSEPEWQASKSVEDGHISLVLKIKDNFDRIVAFLNRKRKN